jgi:hypothetical protein
MHKNKKTKKKSLFILRLAKPPPPFFFSSSFFLYEQKVTLVRRLSTANDNAPGFQNDFEGTASFVLVVKALLDVTDYLVCGASTQNESAENNVSALQAEHDLLVPKKAATVDELPRSAVLPTNKAPLVVEIAEHVVEVAAGHITGINFAQIARNAVKVSPSRRRHSFFFFF